MSLRFKRVHGHGRSLDHPAQGGLTKKRGDSVTFALVNELTGNGVTGNSTLKGNEERLGSRSQRLGGRAAARVAVDDWDEQKSVIDLRERRKGATARVGAEEAARRHRHRARPDRRRELRVLDGHAAQHLDAQQPGPRALRSHHRELHATSSRPHPVGSRPASS
jgi:hypothetical protein